MSTTAEKLRKFRNSTRYSTMSPKIRRLETLQDLMRAIHLRDSGQNNLVAMLRATSAHISMCLGRPLDKIGVRELGEVKPGLQAHLRARRFKKNSIRSYSNYLRILLQKLKEFGWVEYSPKVAAAWRDISRLISDVHGGPGIVRYAIRNDKLPADFSDDDLAGWAESMLRSGRTYSYVRAVKSRFRKRLFDKGFGPSLPNVRKPGNVKFYGIRVSEFPEALRLQVIDLLRWKTANFSPGRPIKGKHRLVTANNLKGLISRIFGFLFRTKGRTANSLEELFSERSLCEYAEWCVNERGVGGRALAVQLGNIRALRAYPPLASHDFSSIPKLVLQLPGGSELKAKERKERKWVRYDVLAQIPGQILKDADAIVDLDDMTRALMNRNALLILWLVTLPWRRRNFRECRILPVSDGGNVWKEAIPPDSTIARPQWVEEAIRANPNETFWQFYFRPEETKTGNRVRGVLPRKLIGPLETYLDRFRPILVNGNDPHTLFVNSQGNRFNSVSLESLVGELTLKYTGRRVNPHLYRDIFARKWLQVHPKDYLTLSKILWHRNIQTTLLAYAKEYDESDGAVRVDEWLGGE